MIDVKSVACTSSFMMLGMAEVDFKRRVLGPDGRCVSGMYTFWDLGGLELHLELSQYAQIAEEMCQHLVAVQNCEFPGIFDYEVSEPFGTWFAEHLFEYGTAPDQEMARTKLAAMCAEFFAQDGHHPPNVLTATLLELFV